MSDFPDESENDTICPQAAARRLIGSDTFWFGAAFVMLLLGLIGRYGITWAVWTAVGGLATISLYGYLPKVKAKKRLEWEVGREALWKNGPWWLPS